MKKLLIILMAFSLLTACKDKKEADAKKTETKSTDDYRSGDNKTGDDNKGNEIKKIAVFQMISIKRIIIPTFQVEAGLKVKRTVLSVAV